MTKYCLPIFAACCIGSSAFGQKTNWQNLDLLSDTVFGISTEKAYNELLKTKKAKEVIVAVIDMGIDTTHEDLRSVLWTNPGEIPGNQIDDDKNGYVDDIHGWNFLGNQTKKQDVAILAMHNKPFYDSLSYSPIPASYQEGYRANRRAIKEYDDERTNIHKLLVDLELSASILDRIVAKTGKEEPFSSDFADLHLTDLSEQMICKLVIRILPYYANFKAFKKENVEDPQVLLKYQLEHAMNIEDSAYQRKDSGNNDIMGPLLLLPESSSYHGTNVAGILAADRNNSVGIKGVADHVKIMSLRVISFFQQMHDESLARAIVYAVDNDARIINLSFGNNYSLAKRQVDSAVRYAMSKDVLIVRAAGNDGIDLDQQWCYPNKVFQDGGEAENWITVGASSWRDDSTLVPSFSNFGKSSVDVFAPGHHLVSCENGSTYGQASGTSLAAPMVAGLAALIWEYYPSLHANQVKEIILKSVVKVNHPVVMKDDSGRPKMTPFSDLCATGGIVNAYNALKLASEYH